MGGWHPCWSKILSFLWWDGSSPLFLYSCGEGTILVCGYRFLCSLFLSFSLVYTLSAVKFPRSADTLVMFLALKLCIIWEKGIITLWISALLKFPLPFFRMVSFGWWILSPLNHGLISCPLAEPIVTSYWVQNILPYFQAEESEPTGTTPYRPL